MSRALVLSLALLAGCRDRGIAELEGVRDEICKCKTSHCGEDALKRVADLDVKNTHRAQSTAREMMECLARLHEAEKAPPPAEDDQPAAGSGSAAP